MVLDVTTPVASLRGVDAPPHPGRIKRAGGLRLAAVAALVLAVGAAGVAYKRSTERAMHDYDGGPVRTESDTTTSIRVDVGQIVTFGGIILRNFTDKSAVLEEIRIDPPLDSGMTLVDVKVAGKERGIGMIGTDRGFPPSGVPLEALRPLRGAIVPPRDEDPEWGVEVMMGFRLDRPGQFGFHHALIDYRIGNKRHRVRASDGFFICGGPEYPSCDRQAYQKREND